MIVLREAIKEKKGNELLERLGEVWTSFYKSILPMLLAIFYPIQEQGTTIRSVTLVGFRDMVLLKTKVADALEPGSKPSPEIKQMLLVLASVNECSPPAPPSDNYLRLEQLVACVVSPYLGTSGLHTPDNMLFGKRNSIDQKLGGNVFAGRERKLSVSQMLKEEVTRKFRRSGSLTTPVTINESVHNSVNENNNNNNNNNSSTSNKETSSFKKRFIKIGDSSPAPSKSSLVISTADHTVGDLTNKASIDNDEMLAYLEERKQRWKNRDEMLGSESLLE